jgi:hypothetical protein
MSDSANSLCGMGNVLSAAKREQMIALGGWDGRFNGFEQATGVRRETAGAYLQEVDVCQKQ